MPKVSSRATFALALGVAAFGLVVVASAFGARALAGTDRASRVPLSAFPQERIAVETRSIRRHLFAAWRAESEAAREQGLMFVEDGEMRRDQAMIFVYDPPEYVSMWMKNTLLPLDMLFVDQHGCIVTIKQHAKPGSLATIDSRHPVSLIVELKAGVVAEAGMQVGDRVVRVDQGWPRDDHVACTRSTDAKQPAAHG
jgi:uncharacterized membrane protein (UPF0127 family)